MKWLARLKKIEIVPEVGATKPTETLFVVSVAPVLVPVQKTGGNLAAANDPTDSPKTVTDDTETPVRIELVRSELHTETVALNSDRHCWPNSPAMNGREIETFMARLARFTTKGVTHDDGEALADKLVVRDRQQDDRGLCLECNHLTGHGARSWRCANGTSAGIAMNSRNAQLPAELVLQLQRCDGFATALCDSHSHEGEVLPKNQ